MHRAPINDRRRFNLHTEIFSYHITHVYKRRLCTFIIRFSSRLVHIFLGWSLHEDPLCLFWVFFLISTSDSVRNHNEISFYFHWASLFCSLASERHFLEKVCDDSPPCYLKITNMLVCPVWGKEMLPITLVYLLQMQTGNTVIRLSAACLWSFFISLQPWCFPEEHFQTLYSFWFILTLSFNSILSWLISVWGGTWFAWKHSVQRVSMQLHQWMFESRAYLVKLQKSSYETPSLWLHAERTQREKMRRRREEEDKQRAYSSACWEFTCLQSKKPELVENNRE